MSVNDRVYLGRGPAAGHEAVKPSDLQRIRQRAARLVEDIDAVLRGRGEAL